ncbi:ferredoxin reductase family protein [Actinoplanes derwentensis]|uniref:Predicted ferric reductase n=1 Tax=Actinoplanes derwentensis TaxID=113562 RepID=A0A1H2A896_9ACTN|nr:ferredoxin reductase family protein [Actinoplanes derwentensis]GID88474.1 oxidoreductase [Actinoplanes derwentensis]SDT42002.1 Predicted ferric reductase [Actinoplanes derwentensis]
MSTQTLPDSTRRHRSERRALAATALTAAFWLTVVMTFVLFAIWGGPQRLTAGTALTSLGTMAGLLGTDLVLVMVFLAARVPLVDRIIGHDVALAHHRRLGEPALYLILAHFALLTTGRSIENGHDVVAETLALIGGPEDTGLAYIGLVVFVVVVVTSAVTAIRRWFSHEVWFAVHALSYLGIVMALPHQSMDGAVLDPQSNRCVYWLTLYAVAFGSMLVFRVVVPIVRSVRHGIRVTSVERIAPDVVSIHLSGRRLDRLRAAGGQYAIWRFWTLGTWFHGHPVSLSAVPTATTARITVRALGAGSARISRVRPGTRVGFAGLFGIFTDAARSRPRLAVVAAGVGVTPVRAMLEDSPLSAGEATIVLRGGGADDRYLWDEVETLAAASESTVIEMSGPRPEDAGTWMSADAVRRGVSIEDLFPDLMDSDLYVCGPPAWADVVVRDARAAGLPPAQIHIERFDW